MNLRGEGLEQNDRSAAEWFRRPAEQELALAQSRLGTLYEHGRGAPRDQVAAYQ